MEVRQRVADTVRAGETESSKRDERVGQAIPASPLVEKGLRLYSEAERSGFHEEATLASSLEAFLRAAEEGVDDATEWISSFLDSMSALPSSVVLPPSLLGLMRWVGSASEEEKKVSLVAEDMFSAMARGKTAIPKSEFDDAVQNLLTSRFEHSPELIKSARDLKLSVKKLLCCAAEKDHLEEVTKSAFCEAAITYARGELPRESGELTPQQQSDFEKANLLKKAVNYPVQTAHYVKWSILKIIERRGVKWIWSSFPTKQFYLLLLAYVLPMISGYFILSTIATLLLAGSLLAMSVSTLQIIVQAEKIFSFMEYSSVFQYFSPSERKIDTKKPEELLIKRSAFPYLTFALSFCLALIMLNLSYQRIIPFEFICLISLLFTVGIFIQFQCYKSTIFILTASSRLLGWFYVFLVVFSTVLPIPHFLFHIGSSIVSIPVFLGFALKLNLMTLVQFPLQFALIAYFLYQNKWHNFYSGLGPYLLFVSWWVLCRHFFSLSSPLYLFLATFGVLMLLVVIPFLPILFLGSPIFFFFFYGLSRQFLISLCLVVVFALLLLFVGKYFGQLMETKWLNIPIDYLLLIQILVSIPVIIVGASWFASLYKPENLPVVTLTQYSEYCGPHNWVAGNMAQTQIDCLHLENRVLMASGTIERIKMHEIVNDMELSLKSLPTSIRVALTCLFGQSDAMCGHRSDMETCQSAYTGCHFQHSNKYTFLVAMTLLLPPPEVSESKQQSTNLSVNLLASNEFAQVVMDLEVGMNLEFNATFVSGMGSDHVTLRLTEFRGIESEENVQRSSDVFLFLDQFIISVTNSVAILFDVLLGYTTV